MGGVLAVVHEGDGVAVEVGVAEGGIEVAVGVSAKDEVYAACAGNEFHIIGNVPIDRFNDLPFYTCDIRKNAAGF